MRPGPVDGAAPQVGAPRPPASVAPAASVEDEFASWLDRVRSTFEAVRYTCSCRLADPSLAEPVAVAVAAGMVSRPAVFRYFGLPYSGRIARLAETRIAEADAGVLAPVCGWPELYASLEAIPAAHRDALVVTCVRGDGVEGLARERGCDVAAAAAAHRAMLDHLRLLAAPGLAPDPDGADRAPTD